MPVYSSAEILTEVLRVLVQVKTCPNCSACAELCAGVENLIRAALEAPKDQTAAQFLNIKDLP